MPGELDNMVFQRSVRRWPSDDCREKVSTGTLGLFNIIGIYCRNTAISAVSVNIASRCLFVTNGVMPASTKSDIVIPNPRVVQLVDAPFPYSGPTCNHVRPR